MNEAIKKLKQQYNKSLSEITKSLDQIINMKIIYDDLLKNNSQAEVINKFENLINQHIRNYQIEFNVLNELSKQIIKLIYFKKQIPKLEDSKNE